VTGQAPLIAMGDERTLKVKLDFGAVADVIAKAPKIAHFWLQGFLHRSFVLHRLEWFKRKTTQFGRGGGGGKGIRVSPVNQGPASPTEQDVVYRVTPKQQKAASVTAAIQGLEQMSGEAFAGSQVLKVHEFGEDVHAGKRRRFLAVPIKTRPGNPAAWLQKYPGKKLELRPSKKHPGEGVLYEVTKVRGRGRPKKGQDLPALREKLRLRFVLKRVVDMKPTLHFYDTWDQLQEQRDQLLRGAADRMHKQLQEGDPRDF
jgi:hypothetical protein